jgi:hypothetical protein
LQRLRQQFSTLHDESLGLRAIRKNAPAQTHCTWRTSTLATTTAISKLSTLKQDGTTPDSRAPVADQ